ncbi:hypothetical protein ACFL6P_10075, partial [Candidatus Latescibacterota bacterium]
MKKLIKLVTVCTVLISVNLSSDILKIDAEKIAGSWLNGNFYYSFNAEGVMRAIKIDSEPLFYQTYKYELISMGAHELIRYGKDLSDSASVQFLFAAVENDSVTTFAYSTPFVRADSANGLAGEWIRVHGYSSIYWNIGKETVDYMQSSLDVDTGELVMLE